MAEEHHNKSVAAIQRLARSIQLKDEDICSIVNTLRAHPPPALKTGFEDLTVNEKGELMENPSQPSWNQFCHSHHIDSDRFKEALQPLMELEVEALAAGELVTLRELGEAEMLFVVDWFLGATEKPFPFVTQYDMMLRLWFDCAVFLAQNPSHPIPACMTQNFEPRRTLRVLDS